GCVVAIRMTAQRPRHRSNGEAQNRALEVAKVRQRILLLLSVTAFSALIEFPFAAPIYFCYIAPLVVLTLSAIVGSGPAISKAPHLAVAAGLMVFAILRLNPGFIYNLGKEPGRYVAVRSEVSRMGLRIEPDQRDEYRKLLQLIVGHATGQYVYAAPDCP